MLRLVLLLLVVGAVSFAADRAMVRVADHARAEGFRQAALEVKCPAPSAWLTGAPGAWPDPVELPR